MDFSNLIDASFLSELLSESGKASLAEKLVVVGVVWLVMGRKVTSHFKSLEHGMNEGFAKVTESIGEVRAALTQVESNHGNKLQALTKRVEHLEERETK